VNRRANDLLAATPWAVKQVRVYQRLAETDPEKYRPALGDSLFNLLYLHSAGLDKTTALTFAHQGLVLYEELAGLRPAGSDTPVDYDQLAAFNPNEYWDWPKLTGALRNLAYALRAAGDSIAGSAAMRNRVNVADRLVKTDPGKWQAEVDLAHKQAAAYGN
jgi:hypothetical protein